MILGDQYEDITGKGWYGGGMTLFMIQRII